jgi:RNA-binding protein YhbY
MQKQIQLGKQGLTDNFMISLKKYFEKNKNLKISVLKSARENKEDVKKISQEILNKLGENYTARIIGFKIALKKWRKPKK